MLSQLAVLRLPLLGLSGRRLHWSTRAGAVICAPLLPSTAVTVRTRGPVRFAAVRVTARSDPLGRGGHIFFTITTSTTATASPASAQMAQLPASSRRCPLDTEADTMCSAQAAAVGNHAGVGDAAVRSLAVGPRFGTVLAARGRLKQLPPLDQTVRHRALHDKPQTRN
jgi:hypothetical protein